MWGRPAAAAPVSCQKCTFPGPLETYWSEPLEGGPSYLGSHKLSRGISGTLKYEEPWLNSLDSPEEIFSASPYPRPRQLESLGLEIRHQWFESFPLIPGLRPLLRLSPGTGELAMGVWQGEDSRACKPVRTHLLSPLNKQTNKQT